MLQYLKELIPMEIIGPLILGAMVWFGVNYVFLGPVVLAPRIAEKYMVPKCMENVQAVSQVFERKRADLSSEVARAGAAKRKELQDKIKESTSQGIQGFFGLYGEQGKEFNRFYGKQIDQFAGRVVGSTQAAIDEAVAKAEREAREEIAALIAQMSQGVKLPNAKAYCACVTDEDLANRFDVAAYTASLRLYSPPLIQQRLAGVLPEKTMCGRPPIQR